MSPQTHKAEGTADSRLGLIQAPGAGGGGSRDGLDICSKPALIQTSACSSVLYCIQ